ncbi:sigma-70 family RNA polymerase sigma factor [Bosea sp. LjRoot237]|uniref:sigma-70 family RNA polymerase sigma factor n=1 Tax=Bosea sp. LjRoot237 TaxID=3342292 RepID=UPI003ECDC884
MPQPANDNRPAEFDAAILAYVPGMHKLARRLRPEAPGHVREDLVQATLCQAFATWRSYRPENSPYTWLQFIMRDLSRDDIKRQQKTAAFKLSLAGVSVRTTPPNQEHAADLALVVGRISPELRADMLDVAQGAPLAEPASRRGTSRQRVEQILKRERARLAGLERQADTRRDVAYGRAA